MWTDEQEARVALRVLRDEPAPPALTTLEQVVRRGRRRVRGQRFGVLVIVLSVLAAAGGGALTLWSPGRAPAPVGAEQLATVYQWPEPLVGWSLVAAASCAGQGGGAAADAAILPREVVEPTFVAGVAEVTGGPANLVVSVWDQQPRGYSEVEVPVDKAWGSVHLEATVASTLPPAVAADADVGVYGVCAMPMRKTLATGTVLQLYAPDARSPFAPVQHLRTYLPNGRLYVVSSVGWSRADVSAVAEDPGGVVRDGRGRLPLDSEQLADVATRIADLE